MRRLALIALVCGCTNKVGFLLEVKTHQNASSIQAGVQKLELVMAQKSFCDRWVEDKSASGVVVDVSKRDLGKDPYTFLVEPVQATDINAEVVPIVLARGAGGQLLGEAGFGALKWNVPNVDKYSAVIEFLSRGSKSDGPIYVADDGCVCLPGQPWMGTGSQSGCDPRVVTSFDRLQDTRGCELGQGAKLPIACDGQQYPNEIPDRALPCFASVNGACRVDTRNCHDVDGYAYDQECNPDPAAPSLPDGTLCDAYLACERNACGDVIGCFTQMTTTPEKHTCTLRIALTDDTAMHPCADGEWLATLATAATACPATILNGTHQPPFTIGFRVPNQTEVQPVGSCPLQLAVDQIDADSYDQVPYSFDFFATIASKLVEVHVDIVLGCRDNVPSLICQ